MAVCHFQRGNSHFSISFKYTRSNGADVCNVQGGFFKLVLPGFRHVSARKKQISKIWQSPRLVLPHV